MTRDEAKQLVQHGKWIFPGEGHVKTQQKPGNKIVLRVFVGMILLSVVLGFSLSDQLPKSPAPADHRLVAPSKGMQPILKSTIRFKGEAWTYAPVPPNTIPCASNRGDIPDDVTLYPTENMPPRFPTLPVCPRGVAYDPNDPLGLLTEDDVAQKSIHTVPIPEGATLVPLTPQKPWYDPWGYAVLGLAGMGFLYVVLPLVGLFVIVRVFRFAWKG